MCLHNYLMIKIVANKYNYLEFWYINVVRKRRSQHIYFKAKWTGKVGSEHWGECGYGVDVPQRDTLAILQSRLWATPCVWAHYAGTRKG